MIQKRLLLEGVEAALVAAVQLAERPKVSTGRIIPGVLDIIVANSIANHFAWRIGTTRGIGNAEPSGLMRLARLWKE